MTFFAPRLSLRLLDEIDRLATTRAHAAEICRLVGEKAEEQGMRRPSYEQVRRHVKRARSRPRPLSTTRVLVDVGLRTRPPSAFLEHVSGVNTLHRSK